MIQVVAIGGVLTVIALFVFFWKRNGIGSGRAFGNRVAAHLGIPKSLFHSLLDHGVKESSRELLASMQKSGLSLHDAGIELGPTLARGIERLEARFGTQDTVDAVKPKVARLVSDFERNAPGRNEALRR